MIPESNFCDTFEWNKRVDFHLVLVSVIQVCLSLLMPSEIMRNSFHEINFQFVFDIHVFGSKKINSLPGTCIGDSSLSVVIAAETLCLHKRSGAPRQRTIHASAMNTKESMWRNLLRKNAQTSWDTTPIIQGQCYVVSEKARCGCKSISEQKQCFMSADYTER